MDNYKIFEELNTFKTNYEKESLEKIGGLKRSQYQVVKMVEYYTDSKYLGTYIGNKKQISGGSIDVPFYNIVNYRVTLARTATDMDTSDIQIKSDNEKHQVHAMILQHEGYEWMKESEFALSLNQMGLNRPKYGGYLIKKNEAEDLMKIDVVRWTNVMTDQNDILGGLIVEHHYKSPVEIKKKSKVWQNVDECLKAYKGIKKDRPNAIDVYEVTGELPVCFYEDAKEMEETEDGEYSYKLQRYFIADVGGKKILLYCEYLEGELSDYYEYLSWEDNGYGLGRGVVEDSEEAQVWTNDAVINEYIAMTLAGRVGLKTNSKKLGNNVLAHDHGKIYELGANEDINSFSLAPSALGQYQNQVNKWNAQADNIASSYNAMTGQQPTSGTPYSQTVLLNQVASKPFDQRREEWGIHITRVFEKWVIPYLIKKLKKSHILVSDYSDDELDMIDESFAIDNTNEDLFKMVISNKTPFQAEQDMIMEGYKNHIKKNGKKRYLEIPDDYFDGIVPKVTVLTTGEQKNKAVILSSLSNLLETVQKTYNPATGQFAVLQDPELAKIYRQIVELSNAGISPMSVGKGNRPTPTTTSGTPQSTPAVPTGAGAPSPMSPALTV